MNIRSRFEFFLAKIAGRNIDIGTLVPPVASSAAEELMLEIAERLDNMGTGTKKVITEGTDILLEDGCEYILTDVTELNLTYPEGRFEIWFRIKFADDDVINVTIPNSQYIGTPPMFDNGETWEGSIKDGVVAASKVVS